ncbi:MAG: alpha/beta hydrolase-fold protein, partial [Sphingomicrobium sp.]
ATIVVGIGYPDGSPWRRRTADLTPSMPTGANLADVENEEGGPVKPGSYGDAEGFHRFMTEELRPILIQHFHASPTNQSLMGYSLGGLFALNVLFRHPDSYRSYVIGSPSIWWNDREVLKHEAAFSALVRSGKVAPRILITSDEWEQSEEAPYLPASGPERVKALAEMREAAMVDNAHALATRLKSLKGSSSYEVAYALFPEETHLTGVAAATSRGVTFVTSK